MTSFRDLQDRVDELISESEDGYWSELSMFVRLSEEVGELGREINHVYGDKRKDGGENIEEELGDVFFTLVCIANRLGIEIEDAVEYAMEKMEDISRGEG